MGVSDYYVQCTLLCHSPRDEWIHAGRTGCLHQGKHTGLYKAGDLSSFCCELLSVWRLYSEGTCMAKVHLERRICHLGNNLVLTHKHAKAAVLHILNI